MSTAPTVSSQPSIWRLGMVDWRFAFGVYASVVVGQFLINSTVSAIMYATSDDFSQHVDQAAVNAAFTTGIYLLITQIITTTTYLRAASLSGASRRTLALSTYVLSAVVIAIASVIWWVLALTQTHIFSWGALSTPSEWTHGSSSWSPGLPATGPDASSVRPRAMVEARGGAPSALSWRLFWAWLASPVRSPGWSSRLFISPATFPLCTPPSGCSA